MYSSSMDTGAVGQDKTFNAVSSADGESSNSSEQDAATDRNDTVSKKRPRQSSGDAQPSPADNSSTSAQTEADSTSEVATKSKRHRRGKKKKKDQVISLQDLNFISTIGTGSFGRVDLMQLGTDDSKIFALKKIKKQHIVKEKHEKHILSERQVMLESRSPFIARLYQTFRDDKYVYMLMEACLGGDIFTYMINTDRVFDITQTRFATACVIEAFDYLHSRNIVYRDLKTENLMFDTRGYVKLVDFGFAKKLGMRKRTWTLCGTTEYCAPEVITREGSDQAADLWALGMLVFELLTGLLPFEGTNTKDTCNSILKGIDGVVFPDHLISPRIKGFITALCQLIPAQRLGYKDMPSLKSHEWFATFDWEELLARTMTSPFALTINGPTDVSNFETVPLDTDIPEDEFSGWDAVF